MEQDDVKQYWETRLEAQFNLGSVGYRGLGEMYNRWLYKVRRSVFTRTINTLSMPLQNAKVLDVGSGTGFYIDRWIEQSVRDLMGSDITEIAIEQLRQRYPQYNFFQVNIGGSIDPLVNFRFDIISAFDVFFHILDNQDYQNAVRNVFSLLTPGGYFIFSENFIHGNAKTSPHVVSRSLTTIQKVLTDNDFSIVDRFPMFYLMNKPIDSSNEILHGFWQMLRYLASKNEVFGFAIGGFLFPLELGLINWVKESPSTEVMVCKKPSPVPLVPD